MSYIAYKAQGMGFDAHLTVLYLGEHEPTEQEHKLFNGLVDSGFNWPKTTIVQRWFIDLFGPETNIPVVRVFVSPAMIAFRKACEAILGNGSEYKGWNPHITLDLTHLNTIHIPHEIQLTDLSLS